MEALHSTIFRAEVLSTVKRTLKWCTLSFDKAEEDVEHRSVSVHVSGSRWFFFVVVGDLDKAMTIA